MSPLRIPQSKAVYTSRWLAYGIVVALCGYFLLNLGTSWKYPDVWGDEVNYTDPAASLLLGKGFTSGTWYAQSATEFWAGNVPAYQFLLYGWLKCFGFSLTAVRSLNYMLVVMGMGLLLRTLAKKPAIRLDRWIFAAVAALLFGETLGNAARLGRPDALAFLEASILYWGLSIKQPSMRLLIIFAASILACTTAIQLAVLIGILSLAGCFVAERKYRMESIAAAMGLACGTGLLFLLYQEMGVWQGFVKSILPHTSAGPGAGTDRYSGLYLDRSLLLAYLLLMVLTFRKTQKRLILGAWGVVIFIPALLIMAGKYSNHYTWMTAVPLVLILAIILRRTSEVWVRKIGVACFFAMALLGLPRILITQGGGRSGNVLATEWAARVTHPGEFVFTDYLLYYGVKPKADQVYCSYYLRQITAQEASRISLIIGPPGQSESAAKRIGGVWRVTDTIRIPRSRTLGGNYLQPLVSMRRL